MVWQNLYKGRRAGFRHAWLATRPIGLQASSAYDGSQKEEKNGDLGIRKNGAWTLVTIVTDLRTRAGVELRYFDNGQVFASQVTAANERRVAMSASMIVVADDRCGNVSILDGVFQGLFVHVVCRSALCTRRHELAGSCCYAGRHIAFRRGANSSRVGQSPVGNRGRRTWEMGTLYREMRSTSQALC